MSNFFYKYLLTFSFVFICVGCSHSIKDLDLYSGIDETSQEDSNQVINLQYLGVGGYLIRYADEHLMIAPSFTNPGFFASGPLMPISANEERIDQMLPPVDDVEIILVSHAHYDHLLDIPHIMKKHAPNAVTYGSNTVGHILAAEFDASRIVKLNDKAADGKTPGEWIYNKNRTIRFMAINSMHAPHLWGIKLYGGRYKKDLKRLPRTPSGWKEGQNFAYLIDFLDENEKSVFRIHYEDSASEPPAGFIPDLPEKDQRRVDLAIMCVASFHEVDDYPEGVITHMQPKQMILGHWEDFFGNTKPDADLRAVRLTNAKKFIERLDAVRPEDSKWLMPKPFAKMQFATSQARSK